VELAIFRDGPDDSAPSSPASKWHGTARPVQGPAVWSPARKHAVSRRALHLSLHLAALAAGAVAVFVVSASAQVAGPPTTASFTAGDNYWRVTGSTETTATIAAGGTVTFSSPVPNSAHNATFTASAPSFCDPPLPDGAELPPWSSTCRFDAPGTYPFVCTIHNGMGGTVQVLPPGTIPPPPPPAPGTPPPGGSPSEPGSPSVKVARRQRGTTLRGSVTTSEDSSRIAITALVSSHVLAQSRPRRIRKVSVGALRKQVATAGKTAFAVRLRRAARRALERRGRLAVDVRIVVTPPAGRATTRTVRVTLRAAR
jgi:plastocyanin